MNNDNSILVASVITLSRFDNDIITAANNGMNGFGNIGKGNLSYEVMLQVGLINEDGKSKDDSLLDALSFEVNRRVEAGNFV